MFKGLCKSFHYAGSAAETVLQTKPDTPFQCLLNGLFISAGPAAVYFRADSCFLSGAVRMIFIWAKAFAMLCAQAGTCLSCFLCIQILNTQTTHAKVTFISPKGF